MVLIKISLIINYVKHLFMYLLAMYMSSLKKNLLKFFAALVGVGQWIEHQPANQRVTGSIPSQDTCLGCRLGPQ